MHMQRPLKIIYFYLVINLFIYNTITNTQVDFFMILAYGLNNSLCLALKHNQQYTIICT